MIDNKKKTIVIGLLLFVICLGIGFAAFSTTLKINGSAKVSPKADNYKVLFASSVTSVTEYSREDFDGIPVPNTLEPSKGTFTDDTTFTNTGVIFTEDGQSIDYKFYILNAGKYDAHITNLDIGKKTCTPGEDADPALAASACSSINLSVILGDEGNQTTYTSSQAISDHVLPKGTWEQIIVRITYPEGSPLVDGELEVTWEDIEIFTSTNKDNIPKPKKENKRYELPNNIFAEIDGTHLTIKGEGILDLTNIKDASLHLYLNDISEELVEAVSVGRKNDEDDDYEEVMRAKNTYYNYILNDIFTYYIENLLTMKNITKDDYINNRSFITTKDNYLYHHYNIKVTSEENITIDIYNEAINYFFDNFEVPTIESVTLENGITGIEEGTFAGLGISSVEFGETFSYLGSYSLAYNNITEIIISENITNISSGALSYNPLKKVTIIGNDKEIDERAFLYIENFNTSNIELINSNFDINSLEFGFPTK